MASADRRTFKIDLKRRQYFLPFCSATKIRSLHNRNTRFVEIISIVCQFAMLLLFCFLLLGNTYLLNGIYAALHDVKRNRYKKYVHVYGLNVFFLSSWILDSIDSTSSRAMSWQWLNFPVSLMEKVDWKVRSDVGGKFEGGMRKENGQKMERKGEERGKVSFVYV